MEVLNMEKQREAKREKFLQENYLKWREQGMALRERRLKNIYSLQNVADRLGTSATRISKLEKGLPVSQAKHLIASYNLLFDYIETKKKMTSFFYNNGFHRGV